MRTAVSVCTGGRQDAPPPVPAAVSRAAALLVTVRTTHWGETGGTGEPCRLRVWPHRLPVNSTEGRHVAPLSGGRRQRALSPGGQCQRHRHPVSAFGCSGKDSRGSCVWFPRSQIKDICGLISISDPAAHYSPPRHLFLLVCWDSDS